MKTVAMIAALLLTMSANATQQFETNREPRGLGKPLLLYVMPPEQIRERCEAIVANARGCWRETEEYHILWVPEPKNRRDMCTWGHELMHARYGTYHEPGDWAC